MLNGILAACIPLAACGDNLREAGPDAGPAEDASPDAALPPQPSLRFHEWTQAIDITPDGRTALFGDPSTPDGRLWFVDTITDVPENRTNVGDPLRTFATGIAQTGTVTALHGEPVQAGVWTTSGGWIDLAVPTLPPCDQDIAGAWDVSANGRVVVGVTWNGCSVEAFRSEGSTMQRLEVLGERLGSGTGAPDNRATVVSDDGSVVAGFAMTAIVDRAPAVWRADGRGELLARAGDDAPGEVLSINANGSVLAGLDGNDGVVWNGATKTMIPRFDTLLPADPVFPNAMTADGAVVFGGQGSAFFGTPEAFIWSEANGVRRISDLVAAAGLTIPAGVVLGNITAASSDGTVLIGTATNPDTFTSNVFTLRLPASAIR